MAVPHPITQRWSGRVICAVRDTCDSIGANDYGEVAVRGRPFLTQRASEGLGRKNNAILVGIHKLPRVPGNSTKA